MVGVGERLGHYQIMRQLGSGGAGHVFQALNHETGEEVALKTLNDHGKVTEDIHKRFIREISVAQKLKHPNIVRYDDCGLDEDVLYFTMELVPWGTLADVLTRRGSLTWQEAVECGMHVCDGLQYLHEANIIHRDLKPANIFLSKDGQLKLGDFGLARDFDSSRLTMDGQTVGTAKYMSPEQARAGSIDGRADVYALGCILFEILAGRPPFVLDDPHSPAAYVLMMQKHVEEQPPKVSDFCGSCPQPLVDLVDRMLAKDPNQRPADAKKVRAALEGILVPGDGATEATQDGASVARETKSFTERLQTGATANRKANPVVLAIVALVVLAVIAIAIFAAR
ncbi:MAG: serine/threonine protein kinase [bacterium]|nr:serine/threonine protein kinase [bacterium]